MTLYRQKIPVLLLTLACLLALHVNAYAQKQQPAGTQPLNSTVSDFGTSFTFSPPICSNCIEAELGFLSQEDGRYAPAVVTFAPSWLHGDASVLTNVLDSEAPQSHRVTHFGNRLDFAIREKIVDHNGFVLTLAPWGTAFIRGIQGGRAGAAAVPQFTSGRNAYSVEFSLTGAVGVSSGNPRSDYVEAFDYSHSIGERGFSIFAGAEHEITAGQQTAGIEQGLTIPFRNGQIELDASQLNLNISPSAQFQARIIVNCGRVFGRHAR